MLDFSEGVVKTPFAGPIEEPAVTVASATRLPTSRQRFASRSL